MVLMHDTLSQCALEVYEVSTIKLYLQCSTYRADKKIAFSYVTRGMQDSSSECALQMYEVSLKYLLLLSSDRGDMIL